VRPAVRAVVQDVDGTMTLPIHDDRTIGVSTAESKFIYAQNARWTWHGIGQRPNQAQETVAAAKQA
jgi:hypothetical protein